MGDYFFVDMFCLSLIFGLGVGELTFACLFCCWFLLGVCKRVLEVEPVQVISFV